jgi:hypothetical protein
MGKWKGVRQNLLRKKNKSLKLELYDLLAEESESKDLASKPPNIVSKIEKSWLRNIFLLLNFR